MLSLLEFLTAAPKSYVIKLHRRENPGEGLLPAAKVNQLVHAWVLRADRVAKALQEADVQGRHLLALIYLAEDRGASEAELFSAQEGFPPSQAALLLSRLEQEMLVYTRQGDSVRTYHGFEELAHPILRAVLSEHWGDGSGADSANWISFRHFLPAHLGHFLCQVELGAVKITQSGEMHRKDSQELASRFSFGERLSTSIPGEEVHFLLRFAVQSRLLAQEEGVLRLTTEGKNFLRQPRDQAETRLRLWWMDSRLKGFRHALKALSAIGPAGGEGTEARPASSPATPATPVAPLANLLWIHGGPLRKGYQDPKAAFTWENLPRALQELWLLGLVDFGMVKGRIAWVRMAKGLAQDLEGKAPEASPATNRPMSLPNLDSLVPLDAPLDWQRRLELVGLKSNDEFMARYRFTKESVIQGLQAGLGMDEFKELLAWLGFAAPAQRTLLDWASTYASTLFMDALVLRVSDPVRLRELQEIPQFMELVTETIPDFGFTLPRHNKAQVRELLQHFGLVPGEDSRRVPQHQPVVLDAAAGAWELASPEAGTPAYRETPSMARSVQQSAADRQSPAAREEDLALRLDTIESAIQNDRQVEFSYHAPTPKHITLKPLMLLRHRSPIKLIGIEVDSGHRNEYLLDQVKSLRLVE